MNSLNPYPGACVCVARWNGDILFDKPHAYDPYKQGDSPSWRELKQKSEKRANRPSRRKERAE